MKNYAIIGDVHSQGVLLAQALAYCKQHDLTPILLGDLFDSRCSTSESIYVYNLAKAAQANGAIILNSNHGERLIDALTGDIEEEPYCAETFRTLREFEEAEIDTTELGTWLGLMPEGFVFFDSRGQEYCCAHAYFLGKYRRNDGTTQEYFVNATNEVDQQHFTWGPMDQRHRRIKWWHMPNDNDFIRVCGHYHKLGVTENAIMLDANSGFEDGQLALYDVESQKVVYFSTPPAIMEPTPTEAA